MVHCDQISRNLPTSLENIFVLKVEFVLKSSLCLLLPMFPNHKKNEKNVVCSDAVFYKPQSGFYFNSLLEFYAMKLSKNTPHMCAQN